MKAYVAYQYGSDISQIFKLLKENNISFYDSLSDVQVGKSLKHALVESIKECDFVIVVYDNQNGNLAYEAGIAAGIKKPIFSIISADGSAFPDFLMDDVHVLAGPSDYQKIKFSFGIFIKKIRPQRTKTSKQGLKKVFKPDVPLYHKINWLSEYEKVEQHNEREIEFFLEKVFKHYSISYNMKPVKSKGYLADFSITSDRLYPYFGNPILVEVRKELYPRQLNHYLKTFSEAIERANAKYLFVFYNEGDNGILSRFPIVGNIIFLHLEGFLKYLNNDDFEHAIIKYRNELIHQSL